MIFLKSISVTFCGQFTYLYQSLYPTDSRGYIPSSCTKWAPGVLMGISKPMLRVNISPS